MRKNHIAISTPSDEAPRLLVKSGIVDLLLGVVKVTVGWLANSHALIADGIHSLSDLATDILVWFLNRAGAEEPDDEHPYGHARFETMGTLILGSVLLVVAGSLIYDSVVRLTELERIPIPAWPALVVAGISIGAKEWLYQITRKLGDRLSSKLLIGNAWHHRSDALSSIIVLIGVSGAMMGVIWLEMVAAIGVALMIALIGYKLIKESVVELVDTALSETYVRSIKETVQQADGVLDVHSLRTRRMGPFVILELHLQVDPTISVTEGHHIGDWVCYQLKTRFNEISDVTVHIDAEDDVDKDVMQMPPLRNVVTRALTKAWQPMVAEQDVERMKLHYLDGVINVELFLDGTITAGQTEHPNTREFEQQLIESAAHLPWLRDVKIWKR